MSFDYEDVIAIFIIIIIIIFIGAFNQLDKLNKLEKKIEVLKERTAFLQNCQKYNNVDEVKNFDKCLREYEMKYEATN